MRNLFSRRGRAATSILAAVGVAAGVGVSVHPTLRPAAAATSYGQVSCGESAARLFQLRANGNELWYSSISGPAGTSPTVYNWRKIYTFNASRAALAVAAHSVVGGVVKLFVTDRAGGLRVYNFDIDKTAVTSTNNLHTGSAANPGPYNYSRLTSDGRRLYGTKEGRLYIMTGITTTAAPRGNAHVRTVGYPLALWGNAGNDQELLYTDTSGVLRSVDITTTSNGFTATLSTVRGSGWNQAGITSPGGGLLIRDTAGRETWRHLIDLPTKGTSTPITTHDVIDDAISTPDLPITTPPDECGVDSSPGGNAGVTYEQLVAMFGSRVAGRSVVETALPGLIQQMQAGNITTPARKAAFLATLVNESAMNYGAVEGGTSPYRGRGFIQLTGSYNYRAAGNYLNTDLLGTPSRAATLAWSDQVARWYWTKARPNTNRYADAHNMGMVNAQIAFAGYDNPGSPEVAERCRDFKNAYKVLAGSLPAGVDCTY